MQGFRHFIRPLVAAGIILAIAITYALEIREKQRAYLTGEVAAVGRLMASKLEERVRARLDVALLLRDAVGSRRGDVSETFGALARTLHSRNTDIQALNWIDPNGVIRIVTPIEGNRAALGLDVTTIPVAARILNDALEARNLRVTPPFTLTQGGRGIVAYLPVFDSTERIGFVNVVFRTIPLIESIVGELDVSLVDVVVLDDGAPLWPEENRVTQNAYANSQSFDVGGRTWTVVVSPTKAGIAAGQSLLDELVLLCGIAAALAFAVALREADRNRAKLIDREERFDLAMEGASDGLFDWNAETGETYYSPRWFQMLGYEPNELAPGLKTFLSLVHPEDERRLRELREKATVDDAFLEDEFRMVHKNGQTVHILSRATVLRDGDKVKRIVGTHVDITELRQQQKDLEVAAKTDDLTGLRNRRGLPEDLRKFAEVLDETDRIAVFHLDLDMFKSINDTLGHEAGDLALTTTALQLQTDPADFDVLARVGGDEFLLAKRVSGPDDDVLRMADATIARIGEPFDYQGRTCRVGASIGVAFLVKGAGVDVGDVIANADIALSTAKKMGRGCSVIFTEGMQSETVFAASLAMEIEDALERDEIVAYFQPQSDISTGELIGLEALARWNHPARGLLAAGAFVPYAEQSNLIKSIDERVLQEACKMVARLAGMGLDRTTVSVNVSTHQLMDPDVVVRFAATAQRFGVPLHKLRIEILESTLLSERTENVTDNLLRFAELGVGMDLDDFGTGHAAISSLLNFPISRVKLDRSLVTNIHDDLRRQAVTNAIIEMSNSLSVDVLAEGVESEAELDFLGRAGCQFAQGYHIARPLSASEVEDFVLQREVGRDGGLWVLRPGLRRIRRTFL